jgi:hypothetical protein
MVATAGILIMQSTKDARPNINPRKEKMSVLVSRGSTKFMELARDILLLTTILGFLAAGSWAIVFSSMNWQRGIYAGMHGNDARSLITKQMSSQYGAVLLGRMRYAGELKTHLIAGRFGPQMRVYRFIGPSGTKYCASEWPAGENFVVNIRKGCRF